MPLLYLTTIIIFIFIYYIYQPYVRIFLLYVLNGA